MSGAIALAWVRRQWDITLLVTLAAAIYRPWEVMHLPLTDFGMFLVSGGSEHSFLAYLAKIAGTHISRGQLSLLSDLYFAAGAATFGAWAEGWHWTYFALNVAILLTARSLLAKIGVSRVAALISLALWAVMGPTAELWFRPAGESVALLLFLAALHQVLNFASADDWRRRITIVLACTVGIVFSKALLVVLLPTHWIVSRLNVSEREWTWRPWSQRDTVLLGWMTGTVLVTLIPVIYVATHVSGSRFNYTFAPPDWNATKDRLEIALVPSNPRLHWLKALAFDPLWALIRTLPNVLWIATILLAAAAERKRIVWSIDGPRRPIYPCGRFKLFSVLNPSG